MRSLAESGLFDIAAHLDLAKKFGFFATTDLTDVLEPALDAIAAADLVVEVNTAGCTSRVGTRIRPSRFSRRAGRETSR